MLTGKQLISKANLTVSSATRPSSASTARQRVTYIVPQLLDHALTVAEIAALTVRWLAKSWDSCAQRLIICTGERMESMICKLYGKAGVRTTDFEIQHSNCLNNEFRCYANYEARDIWKWNNDSE